MILNFVGFILFVHGENTHRSSFEGLRVLSLESRRVNEVAKLIRTYGGEALTAPAMREISLESNQPVIEFAEALMRGAFDLVIFTTGVGVRSLVKIVSEVVDRERFLIALRSAKIAARGPKSSSALRELQVPITVVSSEPFTWRAMMFALEEKLGSSLEGMNLAVQEYNTANSELLTALAEKSISITRLLVCLQSDAARESPAPQDNAGDRRGDCSQ
jgi:uroporphyrinogen-III synthase